MNRRRFAFCVLAFATNPIRSFGSHMDLSAWPPQRSPREIGTRIAWRFAESPLHVPINYDGGQILFDHISYPESCAWYGALSFAQVCQDEKLLRKLQTRFAPLFTKSSELIPRNLFAQAQTFAAVPLQLYCQTRDSRYLTMGLKIADQQAELPALRGLSSQPRHWIVDEAYLITIPQVQAFRSTGDHTYLDRAAREILAYIDRLQMPSGLFQHALTSPYCWARGNGWAAAGMTEVLRSLPDTHADRTSILASYQAMMGRLLKYQAENGLWRQLIDYPEAWTETSGSAMFIFSLSTGIKKGWIDARTFSPAVRKGWLALTEHINEASDLSNVSEGTFISNDDRYYLNRKRRVGDLHGQAPLLWSAAALLS